jgi:hypothetical protein
MFATGISWVRGWKNGKWIPRPCTNVDAYSFSVNSLPRAASGIRRGRAFGSERSICVDSPGGL